MIIDNPGRWLGVFGLVTMVGTISGAMYAGRLYMRRRADAIISAGIALGFSSAPDDEVRFPEIRLLAGKGSLAKYSNALKGCSARYETVIFDFSYVTGSGRSTRGVSQTVAAFHLPGANMPDFQLVPRTLATKIAPLFGAKQLRFDANPNFSDRYVASGADLESAATLFTPGVLSFFEGHSTNLLTVEGYWDWIIVYQPEHRVRPSDLGGFLEVSSQIASGLLGQVARPLLAK
jgi:hypothetical protein